MAQNVRFSVLKSQRNSSRTTQDGHLTHLGRPQVACPQKKSVILAIIWEQSPLTKAFWCFSRAYQGKDHDKGILNREQWSEFIPDEVKIQGDLGFVGLQNELVNVEIPHKKPKGGKLTDKQKEENQDLASERVVCEHAFAGVKHRYKQNQVSKTLRISLSTFSVITSAVLVRVPHEAEPNGSKRR